MATIFLGSTPTSNNISDAFPNSFTSNSEVISNEYIINPNLTAPVSIADQGSPVVKLSAGNVDLFQAINVGGTVQIRITFDTGAVINLVTRTDNAVNYSVTLGTGEELNLVELTEAFGLVFPESGDPAVSAAMLTIEADGTITDPSAANNVPVAEAVAFDAVEDGDAIDGQLVATDADADDTLTFALAEGQADVAGFTLNADGSYSFDPSVEAYQALAEGEAQAIVVNYTVTDGEDSADSTITINLTGANDAPSAQAAVEVTNEDDAVIDGQLIAEDVDNGAVLTFALAEGQAPVAGLTLNADGSYSFDPSDVAYQSLAQGEVQNIVVNYSVTDGTATVTNTLSIAVTGVNDTLTAAPEAIEAQEEGPAIQGQLDATDVDASDVLTYALVGPAVDGLTLNADGSYTFDPALNAAASALTYADAPLVINTQYSVTDGTETVTRDIAITVTPTPLTFSFAQSDVEVAEGEPARFVVTASEAIAAGDVAQVVFRINPANVEAPDQSNGQTNANDFGSAQLNPITRTIAAGETEAFIDVVPRIDNIDEVPEAFTVTATINGVGDQPQISSNGLILDNFLRADDIILTEMADTVTPTSTNPDTRTTDGNDFIFAGTNASATSHTLGTNDVLDGGDGYDTLQIVEDRPPVAGSVPPSATPLIPSMQNVERLLLQSNTSSTVNLVNTTDLERIEVINSGAAATAFLNNLGQNATLVFEDSLGGGLNVGYRTGPNGPTPADLAEVNVELNNAAGSALVFNRAVNTQPDNINTLNLAVAGTDVVLSNTGAGVPEGTNTITGLNGGPNPGLTTLNLATSQVLSEDGVLGDPRTDVADLSIQRETVGGGLFNRLTSVDATGLDGTLNLDLLGNTRIASFVGGDGDTRLVLSGGGAPRVAYDVELGAGDDLFITSAAGLSGADLFEGGDGNDGFEVHFGAGGPASVLGGPVVAAINNATGFEDLIIDRWVSNGDINLDAGVVNTFSNFIFQHTVPGNPGMTAFSGSSSRLGTLEDVVVTNTADSDSFLVNADQVASLNFSAAGGATALDLTLAGLDAATGTVAAGANGPAQVNDNVDALNLFGYSTVALSIDNDNGSFEDVSTDRNILGGNARPLVRGDTSIDQVALSNGTVVNIDGVARRFDFVAADNTGQPGVSRGITVDASALDTLAGSGPVPPNLFDFSALVGNGSMTSVTLTATEQDDVIGGSQGNDILNAGNGNNVIFTIGGNNTVTSGDGDDTVFAVEGINLISTGAGDDVAVFSTLPGSNEEGLTSTDSFDGGEGVDRLTLVYGVGSDAANNSVEDGVFSQVSNTEEFELGYESANVLFNDLARAAGFTDVIGSERDLSLFLGEGFTNDLQVELLNPSMMSSSHFINGSGSGTGTNPYMDDLTIYAEAAVYDGSNIFLGGTGNNTLVVEADDMIADISGQIVDFKTIKIVQDPASNANVDAVDEVAVVLNAPNIVGTGETLTIDATDLRANDRAVIDVTAALTASPTSSPAVTGFMLNITGGSGDDFFFGSRGDDVINAGNGDDYVFGGRGSDAINVGGTGNNVLAYAGTEDSRGTSLDRVSGFTVSGPDADVINIDTSFLSDLGAVGNFRFLGNVTGFQNAQGAVRSQAERAADSDPGAALEAVFDIADGSLWFDTNDNGLLDGTDLRLILEGVTGLQFNAINRTSSNISVNSVVQTALSIDYVVDTTANGSNNIFADGTDLGISFFTNLEDRNVIDFLNAGDLDSLTLGGTTTLGAGTASFADVTLNSGAALTLTNAQHTAFVTDADAAGSLAVGGNVAINISNVATLTGQQDVATYGIQGGSTFTPGAVDQNVTELTEGSSTITFMGEAYTGAFVGFNDNNDFFNVVDGTDLSGLTGDVLDGTFSFAGLDAEITLNGAQNANASFISAAGTQVVNVEAPTDFTAQSGIEQYELLNSSGPSSVDFAAGSPLNTIVNSDGSGDITVDFMGINAGTQTLGLQGANDSIVGDAGVLTNITGINGGAATTAEILDLGAAGDITMTVAQNNAFGTFIGVDEVTFDAAGAAVVINGNVDVAAYQLAGAAGETNALILGEDAQDVTGADSDDRVSIGGRNITGILNLAGGADTLVATNSANLTAATLSNIETLDVSGTVTLNDVQHEAFTAINGAGAVDQLDVLITGAGNINASAAIETYTLDTDLVVSTPVAFFFADANQDLVKLDANIDLEVVFGMGTWQNTVTGLLAADGDSVTLQNGANVAGVGGLTGTDELLIENGASVTVTDTQYNNFDAGTIFAAGTETVTINYTAPALLSANDVVENYVLVGTTGADITFDGADATRGVQSLDLSGSTGVDTVRIDNATLEDNGAEALLVTGFTAGNGGDVFALLLATAPSSNMAFFNNVGNVGAAAATGGDVVELDADTFTFADLTNTAAVESALTAALNITFAGDNSLVAYDGLGNAGLYAINNAGVDIELIGIVSGVNDNAFTAANFA